MIKRGDALRDYRKRIVIVLYTADIQKIKIRTIYIEFTQDGRKIMMIGFFSKGPLTFHSHTFHTINQFHSIPLINSIPYH
ncbi:hypothetical protein BpHYR1_037706 [Brachionus plicatilis]|uniref:Uncharacterized protein n=1 Tax=Brachionus plicatilis TaxID=10195 RepID=A0A3M7PL91_BRAPC|nr:hypothetical protein BpHYR1_037706 [Brachionus plicatilis]